MDITTLPFMCNLPSNLPFTFRFTALDEYLAPLVDQRKRRGKRYPLVPLLLTVLLAKLSGSGYLLYTSRGSSSSSSGLTLLKPSIYRVSPSPLRSSRHRGRMSRDWP